MKLNKQKLMKLVGIVGVLGISIFLIVSLIFKDKDANPSTDKVTSSDGEDVVNTPNLDETEKEYVQDEVTSPEQEIPLFVPIDTPDTETVDSSTPSSGLDITVGEDGTEYVDGVPVSTESNIPYDLQPNLVYDEIFKNAKQLNIGYDLLNYGFELIDASPSYILFLANPEVLVLYDVYNDKLMELDTEVDGGTISDDEHYVVYYKNSYDGSQAYYFNLVNPNGPRPINKTIGEFGDIEMVEGSIYMTYVETPMTHSYDVISYPMVNADYEIPNSMIIEYDKVGHDIYVNEKNELFFFSLDREVLIELKVGKTPKEVKSTKGMSMLAPVSDILYEDGNIYSITLDKLYINGEETEYDRVSSMIYFDKKLYFANDVFLYSYDGSKFEELATHQYVDKIGGTTDSFYMTTLESLLFKLK